MLVLLAGVGLTIFNYQKSRARLAEYETLAAEVESLRRQNQRLGVLETELTHLRELQQQMLRLAGIETALGVDLDLLEELRASAEKPTASYDPDFLVWPLAGRIISGYSLRHPAVDVEADKGQTVVSSGVGVVADVGTDSRYGRRIALRHFNDLETVYANLGLTLVEVGDTVRVGQVIGLVGVGREGQAPHLHFEVLRDGEHVSPTDLIPPASP
jgi:murein DD-endopeptidase MepM/ murein hydrolase activator NlpD